MTDVDRPTRELEERLARAEAQIERLESSSVTFGEVVTLLCVFVVVVLFLPVFVVLGLVLGLIALTMRLLDRAFGVPDASEA